MASNAQRVAAAEGAKGSDTVAGPDSGGDTRAVRAKIDDYDASRPGSPSIRGAEARGDADSKYLKIRQLLMRPQLSERTPDDTDAQESPANGRHAETETTRPSTEPLGGRPTSMRDQVAAADSSANDIIAATAARQDAILRIARAEAAAETEARLKEEFDAQVGHLTEQLATAQAALNAQQPDAETVAEIEAQVRSAFEAQIAKLDEQLAEAKSALEAHQSQSEPEPEPAADIERRVRSEFEQRVADLTDELAAAQAALEARQSENAADAETAAETERRIREEFEQQVAQLNDELTVAVSALNARQSENESARAKLEEMEQTLTAAHADQIEALRRRHTREVNRLQAEIATARAMASKPAPAESQETEATKIVQLVQPTQKPANDKEKPDRYWQEKLNERLNEAREVWRRQEAERLEKAMADWTAKQERLMLSPNSWELWVQHWVTVRGFAVVAIVLLLLAALFVFPGMQPMAAKTALFGSSKETFKPPAEPVRKITTPTIAGRTDVGRTEAEPEWGMPFAESSSTADTRYMIAAAEAATEAAAATAAKKRLEWQVSRLRKDLKDAELRGFTTEIEAQDTRAEAIRIQEQAARNVEKIKSEAMTAAQAEARMRASLEKQVNDLRRKLAKAKAAIKRSTGRPAPQFDAD